MAFQIHDQGTIGAPFAQRPIIHPNDPGFWRWGERMVALQSQQGRGTDRHAQLLAQARARLGTEPKDQLTELCCKPFGAPRKGANGCPKALDKDFPFTGRIGTKEPPHGELYAHGVAGPGQIAHGALIAAMNVGGRIGTHRARRCGLGRCHGQENRLVVGRDRVQTETGRVR